ncbi:hypothetical protein CONPUDRAFT_85000 [Coniophora puteana RWD-64-598 SS2]|uniref:Transmembrane protein 135 N-terminal domain-containing protein n=1 Tax=Coniophora puteana (strain RWD-64-598) TaxID=741705 RepID=A0A5M3MBK7_CONPW|nr:uncharacterized protein CONPUDRAFT_85000 [Coniophora puteana RWD-64-598 SS2]EIW76437.1 hypothetical protein CONPUDRAFT_85000 [Coniophora puteana RWD-64-598 SS2]
MDSDKNHPKPQLPRQPSYIQFTPKRAMASFENLVALANHQERLREARKIVWRNRGEPAAELDSVWECIEHAGRGGMRAGAIAFALRASVNMVLALFRLGKVPKQLRSTLILRAIFGQDSFRFAAMMGSFVSIYKALLNALPILFPVSDLKNGNNHAHASPFDDEDDEEDESDFADFQANTSPTDQNRPVPRVMMAQRHARLSSAAQAHQEWVRKKTRRWHSVLAGAVAGGLAVMFEKRSRRITIAQQLFVRGLQGSYNAYTSKWGWHIPNGEAIVFILCCGQIVYSLFCHPETLPRSYNNWLRTAAGAPPEAFEMIRDLTREGRFDVADLDRVIARGDATPSNFTQMLSRRSKALADPPDFGPPYPPCGAVHPWVQSCMAVPIPRFVAVFRWAFSIYGVLHFIPMLLFKRRAVMDAPRHMMGRALWGTMRSSAFMASFVAIFQGWFCFKNWLHAILSASPACPPWLANAFGSRLSYGFGGLFGALSLFIEEKRRRGELAMYVVPKALESAWLTARGKGWVFRTGQGGEMALTAFGMGMVMSIYQNDPQHLSGLVRRILYQFIGPN